MKGRINIWRVALLDWWVNQDAARQVRAVERANVRAGNYTNGQPMTEEDRAIYHRLTQAAFVAILFIAVLIGALIALAVVGK